jgi:hypothetical protein
VPRAYGDMRSVVARMRRENAASAKRAQLRAARAYGQDDEAEPRATVAAYRAIIGDSPACRAGDVFRARGFLMKIERAIELGGWTTGEQRVLCRLARLWRRRAFGEDAKFNARGCRARSGRHTGTHTITETSTHRD